MFDLELERKDYGILALLVAVVVLVWIAFFPSYVLESELEPEKATDIRIVFDYVNNTTIFTAVNLCELKDMLTISELKSLIHNTTETELERIMSDC